MYSSKAIELDVNNLLFIQFINFYDVMIYVSIYVINWMVVIIPYRDYSLPISSKHKLKVQDPDHGSKLFSKTSI